MGYAKILVVSRGGDVTQPAVKRAVELASHNTAVEVFAPVYNAHLQAYPLSDPGHFERSRDHLVKQHLGQAGAVASELKAQGLNASASAVWDYPYYESIIRRAMAGDADLVISESLSQRSQALKYGDWRLLAASPMPVLLVKSGAKARYDSVVAAVDPFHSHDKPASLDEQILLQAKGVSELTNAGLEVVFCFVPLVHSAVETDGEKLPIDEVETRIEGEKRSALDALLARVDLDAAVGRIEAGKPEALLTALDTDLLVVGALSRGRLKDLIIGSTAERILEQTDADLLVVKPVGFRSHVSRHVAPDPVVNPVFYPF